MKEVHKAVLLLEDGTVFEGEATGSLGKTMGTVVFNTSMVGYQEALTTPANQGLLLTQTFPLIGNYGVNELGYESGQAWAAGYIVREICEKPSNYLCKGSLPDFLSSHQVVGICGIDTRHLTRLIREKGEMRGMILSGSPFEKESCLEELLAYVPKENTRDSGLSAVPPETAAYRVAVLDLGMTASMQRALCSHGAELFFQKPLSSGEETLSAMLARKPHGIFLSDGPGDPAEKPLLVEIVRALSNANIPILGVSLGHQLLALANGMKTLRLKHGHRGANQPVFSKQNGRTYITTQNHGYIVDCQSIQSAVCVQTLVNANDQTCEGLSYQRIPAFSVQFLPDAKAHTHSTAFVWEEFMKRMKEHREAL